MNAWTFDKTKKEETAFFYGYNKDENGQIVIEDIENFRVALTFLSLLKNILVNNTNVVFHIDNTYKTNKSNIRF